MISLYTGYLPMHTGHFTSCILHLENGKFLHAIHIAAGAVTYCVGVEKDTALLTMDDIANICQDLVQLARQG